MGFLRRKSVRREGAKDKFVTWFSAVIDEGNFTMDELATLRQRSERTARKRREDLERYASGDHLPDDEMAYWIGETLSTRLQFVRGPVGLYAAGHIAELIRLGNELVPLIGASRAGLMLASLPMIVDHERRAVGLPLTSPSPEGSRPQFLPTQRTRWRPRGAR